MTNTRTIRVPDDHALDTHRDRLERDGYSVVDETPASVTLHTRDHGSLAWHLFVFVATFWWTVGFGNLLYALYRRAKSYDRVRVRVVAERDGDDTTATPEAMVDANAGP